MRLRTLALLLPFLLLMSFIPAEDEVQEVSSAGFPLALTIPFYDLTPPPPIPVEEEIRLLTIRGEQAVADRESRELQELEDLVERQERLKDLGWYTGQVDGIVGPLTLAAREGFQAEADLDVDPEEVTDEFIEALFSDDAPSPPPPPPPPPAPSAPAEPAPAPAQSARNVWDRLAECESGNWINGGASFEQGSARWDWAKPGTPVPPWGTTIHHGGLQFYPGTWSAFKLDGYPQYAYDASRAQQIAVAERVLAAQGWNAWPTCARKLGLL